MQPQQTPPTDPSAIPPLPFDVPDSVATSPVQAQAATQNAGDDFPPMADDNDLIERDWVVKAKQIITTTANDPHEQSRLLTQLKSDYVQKRYGKTIKAEY